MNIETAASLLNLSNPPLNLPIRRFVIDSRSVEPGDCFVAICGARVDGHNFIDEAFAKGAVCCIAQKSHPKGLLVPDTKAALQQMAKRLLEGKTVYALTGAMGKTTTKHFVQRLMPGAFPVTPANYNTQISLPLTVLNALGQAPSIFLEMGMTSPGDIARLIDIAPPTVAMVTYIPAAVEDYIHASEVRSLEELFNAKMEIFASPKLQIALVPDDLPLPAPRLDAEVQIFSLKDKKADYALIVEEKASYFERGKQLLELPVSFPKHHARNFLAGIAYARALGASLEVIRERAPLFELPPMRFERLEAGGVEIISDAYNASPEAMVMAFDALPKKGRQIGVLGEMLMLGGHAKSGHEKVLFSAREHFERLFCYGKNWEGLEGDFTLFENRSAMVKALLSELQPGDLVYFKGSRDLGLEHAVEELMGELK